MADVKMTDLKIAAPVELTDDEIDAVAGGVDRQAGLVNVGDVTIRDNDVGVVVAAQALTNKSGQTVNAGRR